MDDIEGVVEVILVEVRDGVTIERHFPFMEADKVRCTVGTEIIPGREFGEGDFIVSTMDRLSGITLEIQAQVRNRKSGPPVMWWATR